MTRTTYKWITQFNDIRDGEPLISKQNWALRWHLGGRRLSRSNFSYYNPLSNIWFIKILYYHSKVMYVVISIYIIKPKIASWERNNKTKTVWSCQYS
jgi:hypothetical protein